MSRKRIYRRQRNGYVLLMTVSVIAIVGLLLIAIANHSLTNATDAKRIRRDVQRKWALASCQRYTMGNVGQFLNRTSATADQSTDEKPIQVAQADFFLTLNESQFNVVVNDESAKLDINHLYENVGRAETAKLIRRVIPKTSGMIVRLRPNRLSPDEALAGVNNRFEGWGQVFCYASAEEQRQCNQILESARDLTCWGGKVNLRTASDSVLRTSAKAVVGSNIAGQLVEARKQSPTASKSELIAATQARAEQVTSLSRLLTDRSWSQCVVINARGTGYNKTSQTFRRYYTDDIYRIQSYSW